MADNVAITAGTGTNIATDNIGGVNYQRVKVGLGADGTANDAVAGAGAVDTGTQRVTLASNDPAVVDIAAIKALLTTQAGYLDGLEVLIGGTNTSLTAIDGHVDGLEALLTTQAGYLDGVETKLDTLISSAGTELPAATTVPTPVIGAVVGKTAHRTFTLSLDTSAYASGDLIADTQQIDAFFRVTNGTGLIQSLTLYDQDDQGVALTVYFHNTSTSMGTENSAPSISDANSLGILGWVDVATTDYKDIGGVKVACIRNIGLPVSAVSGTDDLYISVVNSTGTPTFTASGVKGSIGVLLD